ncbi:hypothetical protein MY8738_008404 [Beauveria namnaoensis]
MKAFLAGSRKRKSTEDAPSQAADTAHDDEPTEVKLAMLSSLHPKIDQDTLLDVLLAHDGSVKDASASLRQVHPEPTKSVVIGYQQSLKQYALPADPTLSHTKKLKSKKGSTLHLFDPVDVSEHTPCTIIHNFLPPDVANELLKELLAESETFERITFKLFDNVVSSPHTSSFYVDSYEEMMSQKSEFYYNGAQLTDVRRITPQLSKVKPIVQETVNKEIQHRIKTRYPGGKKLKYQSPHPWVPNSAFVNCYNGAQQSVGYHSDQLTYLGPRAVIGSISLGVAREFRVRRVLPKDAETRTAQDSDAEGQISIHLPQNSLLVMHAEMQEEWKHCIVPALSIDPHPIAGNRRINITYRDYRAQMHPSQTPRCACKIPCVLRVVQRKQPQPNSLNLDYPVNTATASRKMAEKLTFSAEQAALLEPHLPPMRTTQESGIYVTLTYASSLDSSLSLAPGVRTRLSGPESKAMTHYLRARHNAILIGVSTLLADDPALNCRIAGAEHTQPRPVIIDPHLRWTPQATDKVLETQRRGAGLAPFVITAESNSIPEAASLLLEQHGGKYIPLKVGPPGPDGRLRFDWHEIFARLADHERISSVMVEGGGKIINSLLDPAYHNLINSVIVTLAPTWLGQGGVVVSPARVHDQSGSPVAAARLHDVSWHPFGEDIVLCGKLQ